MCFEGSYPKYRSKKPIQCPPPPPRPQPWSGYQSPYITLLQLVEGVWNQEYNALLVAVYVYIYIYVHIYIYTHNQPLDLNPYGAGPAGCSSG